MKHLKSEFDKLSFREALNYIIAIVCLVTGTVAVFLSLYIPPVGEIHNSVLTYFGLCTTFAGILLGVSTVYNGELLKFKKSVTEMLEANGFKIPNPPKKSNAGFKPAMTYRESKNDEGELVDDPEISEIKFSDIPKNPDVEKNNPDKKIER